MVSSIHSLFESIQAPKTGKAWSWLRTAEARTEGATLVLVLGHPLGPDPSHTGHAYLTTAHEAVACLKSKRTVIVIDLNAMIMHLEDRTGRLYQEQTR